MYNKEQTIRRVSERLGVPMTVVAPIMDAILASFTETLVVDGEDIQINNFGKFHLYQTKDRVGRNPATGAPIQIKAKKTVKFQPSDALLQAFVDGKHTYLGKDLKITATLAQLTIEQP